jgi:peptide/nickel transport system permease protein
MDMLKYIAKRLLAMIPVLLGVLIIVYALSCFMPGDPVRNALGTNNYTQEQYDAKAHEMGLDQPFLVQLGDYLWGVITRFDLGEAYSTHRPVTESLSQRAGVSIKLGLMSLCLAAVIGIPIGVFSAVKQNTVPDYIITTLSIILASLPAFWLAMEAIQIFAAKLSILPASGLTSWKHYILPVTCSSMMTLASLVRMTRSSMLEVIRQDYIRTARSKGMKEKRVIFKHALKNALIPIITVVGNQVGMVVGGSIIVETIFNIPGMGMLMMGAINQRDYPLIMGVTLVCSVFVCVCNLVVDIIYSLVDPQIRGQFAGAKKSSKKETKEVAAA